MPAFFHRDTDADVLYCAAPAVPAQLLLASHQKKPARLYVLTMSQKKKKNYLHQRWEKRHQKVFQSHLNFLPVVVRKVLLLDQE